MTRDRRANHQRVAADLRAKIMAGEIPPRSALPSTQQLIDGYGVANSTVQRALTTLKDEGLVAGERGRGVFVCERRLRLNEPLPYRVPGLDDGYGYDLLEVSTTRPPVEVAAALDLKPGQQAVLRRRLMRVNREPVELIWSYYPASIAVGSPLALPGKIRGGAPLALADLGYPQRRMEDRLTVRLPTSAELELLELPMEVPVIRRLRVVFTDRDLAVEASILVKSGHRSELLYRRSLDSGAQ
ncbi:GntR family transcriptional regulator [Actinorhabdospora filicis]|uniref:GntR family transcriptional regulator n=1 Tax=Actinorhabdospora filicis TaxID=1785913 RepID=A0A9W6SJ14_9ACTN|nr:GntR family transcriptional regulator [Actinorhabdospora filicis]GLZ76712.1 GntR family transcriptional regulator [Actinorhabdospora filicis]